MRLLMWGIACVLTVLILILFYFERKDWIKITFVGKWKSFFLFILVFVVTFVLVAVIYLLMLSRAGMI